MQIIEAIGCVIAFGLAFGMVVTVVFIATVFSFSEPDCDDQDDIDIRENEYWKKFKK